MKRITQLPLAVGVLVFCGRPRPAKRAADFYGIGNLSKVDS
jgi:hypothetical protein